MTMAMQAVQIVPDTGPKLLKIAKLQGGRIVEERTIRKRETVLVGADEQNHFALQVEGLPNRFPLLQLVGNDYILNFTESMRGKVRLPAGTSELENLRQTGAARNAGGHWQVKLTDNSTGQVKIGNIQLLFHFVTPPPPQPKPQLPAAARGGLVKAIDWEFTAFIVFSFIMHFGFIVYLFNADWPIPPGIGQIDDETARLLIPEEPPPEEKPDEKPSEKGDEPAETKTETRPTKQANNDRPSERPSETENVATNTEARARMVEQASAAAEALLLTAFERGGAFSNVLAGGAITGSAEDVLANAGGVGVANGASGTLRPRGGGGNGSGTGGFGLGVRPGSSQGVGEGGEVVEVRVRGRATVESGEAVDGDGEFDQSKVTSMVRTRLAAIRSCYERELRTNPSLSGKIAVQFTIQQTGSVTGARVDENTMGSDAVGTCIVGVVRGFRFNPGPENGSVTYSYPFVFAPQG